MEAKGKYCRLCTRTFYGKEYRVENGICQFCQAEIDIGHSEEFVSRKQQQKLKETIDAFRHLRSD